MYALTRLMLIEDISGMAKYSTLVAVNIVVLTSLNYLTDSSHLQKPRNLSAGDHMKNFVSKVLSSMLSMFVRVEFAGDSMVESNYKLSYTVVYQVFQLMMNSFCFFLYSGLDGQDDTSAWVFWILIPWTISVLLEVR